MATWWRVSNYENPVPVNVIAETDKTITVREPRCRDRRCLKDGNYYVFVRTLDEAIMRKRTTLSNRIRDLEKDLAEARQRLADFEQWTGQQQDG